ncbi:MAG: hypothetical protein V1874_00090 [Spirochaetota bacterium]
MEEKKKKSVIPIGIFFIIFLVMLILSAAVSAAYFYFETTSRVAEMEKYTRDYSIPLAEAFANVAELSYKNNDLAKLNRLFREKIQASVIAEGFFVLSDGKIIVHSSPEIEKELKGNIATDEFAYNIDLIMLPIWTKVEHAQFMDYHIYGGNKKLPFPKEITRLIKSYVYPKIDVSGWLVTKAVIVNTKSIGCISFIISKNRINNFLLEHLNNTVKLSIILASISFILSLFISLIVYFRYRSIRKNKITIVEDIGSNNIDKQENFNEKSLKEAIKVKHSVKIKDIIITGKNKIKDAILVKEK